MLIYGKKGMISHFQNLFFFFEAKDRMNLNFYFALKDEVLAYFANRVQIEDSELPSEISSDFDNKIEMFKKRSSAFVNDFKQPEPLFFKVDPHSKILKPIKLESNHIFQDGKKLRKEQRKMPSGDILIDRFEQNRWFWIEKRQAKIFDKTCNISYQEVLLFIKMILTQENINNSVYFMFSIFLILKFPVMQSDL